MAAAQKLADSLRPASFRGVPFQVNGGDLGAGRRTQLHEYPQRDKPWVEDLGRATRELSFDGFLVGKDYIDQANKLLAALEQAGPGALVHPWLGSMQVCLKDLGKVSFDNALGVARVSMSFVESGDLDFPAPGAATQSQSRLAAANIEQSAMDDFAKNFSVAGFQDFVAAAANVNLTSVIGIVSGGSIPGLDALGFANRAADTLASVLTLLSSPSALASRLARFIGISGLLSTGMRWASLARSLQRLGGHAALAAPVAPPIYTPSRQQAYVNATAVNALVRQLVLAQAVGVSSLVPTQNVAAPGAVKAGAASLASASASPAASATYTPTWDETVALRNDLAAALDAEALQASDGAYVALTAARGAVWQDLTARSRDSARLTTLTPTETAPALALAYDLYEDAAREADIVTRNGIRHPGFVPPAPLRVVTR